MAVGLTLNGRLSMACGSRFNMNTVSSNITTETAIAMPSAHRTISLLFSQLDAQTQNTVAVTAVKTPRD